MGAAGSFRVLGAFLFRLAGLEMPEEVETGGGDGDFSVDVLGTVGGEDMAGRMGTGERGLVEVLVTDMRKWLDGSFVLYRRYLSRDRK